MFKHVPELKLRNKNELLSQYKKNTALNQK